MKNIEAVQAIIAKLGTSKPVFRSYLSPDRSTLTVRSSYTIDKYNPKSILEGREPNLLEDLVIKNYSEHFSLVSGKFYVSAEILRYCNSQVEDCIMTFLEKNLPMRSPRQSKVYKFFYRSSNLVPEITEISYELYKFMRTFCDSSLKAEVGKEEHVKTTIALLEAIQEKYGRE